MGDASRERLSDAGSIPARSIKGLPLCGSPFLVLEGIEQGGSEQSERKHKGPVDLCVPTWPERRPSRRRDSRQVHKKNHAAQAAWFFLV